MIYRKISLFVMLCFGSLNSYSAESQKETGPLRLTREEIADPSLEVLDASTMGVSLPWLNQQDITGWFVSSSEDLTNLRDDSFWGKKVRVTIADFFTLDRCKKTTCPVLDIKKESGFVLWGNTLLTGGEPARTITITQYKLLDEDVLKDHLLRRLYSNGISPANKSAACAFLKEHFGIKDLEDELTRLFRKEEKSTTLRYWKADDDTQAAYPMTPDRFIDFKQLDTVFKGLNIGHDHIWRVLMNGKVRGTTDLSAPLKIALLFPFLVSINTCGNCVAADLIELRKFPYLRVLTYGVCGNLQEISKTTFSIKEFGVLSEMGNLEEIKLDRISDSLSHVDIFAESLFLKMPTLKKLIINKRVYNRPTESLVFPAKSPLRLYVQPSQRDYVWDMVLGLISSKLVRRGINIKEMFVLQLQKTVFVPASLDSAEAYFVNALEYLGEAAEKVLGWITKISIERVTEDRLTLLEKWFPSFNRVSSLKITGTSSLNAVLERTPYYADADSVPEPAA